MAPNRCSAICFDNANSVCNICVHVCLYWFFFLLHIIALKGIMSRMRLFAEFEPFCLFIGSTGILVFAEYSHCLRGFSSDSYSTIKIEYNNNNKTALSNNA